MNDDTRPPRPRISFGRSSLNELDLIPLRLAAIADLTPADFPSRGADSQYMRVDKDSFDDVLRALCPRISFHIQSPSESGFTRIEFPVTDLKSFHPVRLVQQVGPLRLLVEARQAVLDLRDQKLSPQLFLEKIKSVPQLSSSAGKLSGGTTVQKTSERTAVPRIPVVEPASDIRGDLDSILDLVDLSRNQTEPARTSAGALRIQQFIDAMSEGSAGRHLVDRSAIESMLAETDNALSSWLDRVLRNPEFRRLESAWRALKFLVDHIDFREAIQLQVIAARREDLESVLNDMLEDGGSAEIPVAAVITDFEFANTPSDLDSLRSAAQKAAQLQAPLLVNVGSAFFSRLNVAEVTRIPSLRSHLESAEFVKWRSFREVEASRWAGVCFNRFLLRRRYDEAATGRLPFRFRETGEGLLGNASWAIGALLAGSFAKTRWCGKVTGLRGGGAVEGLPLHPWRLPSGEEVQIPLEAIFLQGREDDFYEEGFLVLQAGSDQDTAVLVQAPSAHRPERYSDARETVASRWRATLTYQLIASRVARCLDSLIARLSPTADPSELQLTLERGLGSLLETSGAAAEGNVQVRLRNSEERPGFLDLLITVRPGPSIWSVPVAVELSFTIRRT
jgi:type VI secretion system protein ImpC